jgi:hypothetical protein
MNQLIVDLSISADEFLKLYRGSAQTVHAYSRDGRKVHFPAKILTPFVEHDGVSGSFIIEYDSGNHFSHIQKL